MGIEISSRNGVSTPNFHSVQLVIAAEIDDMLKVLRHIADNLSAGGLEGLDNPSGLIESTSPEPYFRMLRYPASNHYEYLFSGASVDKKQLHAMRDELVARGWDDRFFDSDVPLNAPRQVSVTAENGLTMTASFASRKRLLSDSATLSMERYGNRYTLLISYDTAGELNIEDLDLFFLGLPKGEYGVALYDSDEYDNYLSVECSAGTHTGRHVLEVSGKTPTDDIGLAADLYELAREYRTKRRSRMKSLGTLADAVAMSKWDHSSLADVLDEFEGDFDGWDEDYDEMNDPFSGQAFSFEGGDGGDIDGPYGGGSFNLDASDARAVLDVIACALPGFPKIFDTRSEFARAEGSKYLERNTTVDSLTPGDSLVLVSNWDLKHSLAPEVKVFTVDGRAVGILSEPSIGMPAFGEEQMNIALACLVPHLRATVESVVPVFVRGNSAVHSLATVRVEINDTSLSSIVGEVHELLGKSPKNRSLSSTVKEEA